MLKPSTGVKICLGRAPADCNRGNTFVARARYAEGVPFATGDIRIHYETGGEGPPLLLLQHAGASRLGWSGEFLARLAGDFRLILGDSRGTGRSDKPDEPFTVLDMAGDGVLDDLGVARAHLLGLSMGGAVAQELVLYAPERVERLVLVSTLAGWARAEQPPEWVRETWASDPALSPMERRRRLLAVNYSRAFWADHGEQVSKQMARATAGMPLHATVRQGEAISGFDTYDRLPHIPCSTLVVHGTEDVVVPPQNGRVLARRIPHARFAEVDGAGHIPMTEQPETVARIVRDFLDADQP